MTWTTTNRLNATQAVHQKYYAWTADEEIVSPSAFSGWRHLDIAS
jgi:hypothetical protein